LNWVQVLLVAGLAAIPAQLIGQTTAFTYQGRLTDNGGPANGLYDLQFAIFASDSGGSNLTEPITTNNLGITNGLFTVTLDFGQGVFDGGGRWLEISARTNGAIDFLPLNPRQALTSVPTVIFAGTAATALSFSGALPSQSLSGSYGSAVNFNNSSNSFSGNGAGLFDVAGALPAKLQSGVAVQATANTSYVLTNSQPVTITLPAAPNIGDVLRVAGIGSGGWKIAQNPGQSVLGQNLAGPLAPWNSVLSNSTQGFTISSSADGTHLIFGTAVYLQISSDSGTTWSTPANQPIGAARVAASADGAFAVAAIAGRSIYTSVDFGNSWVRQTNSFVTNYDGIASSADGSRLVAITSGAGIYTSADFGTNWAVTTAPTNNWISITTSANGSHLAAAAEGGGIYLSTDFGATWNLSSAAQSNSWSVITGSADGTRLFAFDNSTNAWFSTDAGQHWQSSPIANGFNYGAASSADGLRVAVNAGPNIYLSTDGGLTWSKSNAPIVPWRALASSATGNFLATGSGANLYAYKPITSMGTGGYLSGGPYAAVELQYVGNGQFLPVNHEGTLLIH
jgi:hypothetical protein